MTSETTTSKLAQALGSRGSTLIVEFVPSASDAESLRRATGALPPSIDSVVVSSDSVSALACAAMLAADGLDPVIALSTRDGNRNALLAEARGAALLGVRNVLCVSSGRASSQASPEANTAFDVDPAQLLQLLKDVDSALPLLAGAETFPLVRPLALSVIDTRKKVAAGADFLVTQPIFDVAAFEEWMAAVRQEGIGEQAAVLASVRAIKSVDELAKQQSRGHISDEIRLRLEGAADLAAEGLAVAAETAAKLAAIEGVRGLYVRSSGKPEDIAEIIRRAGLRAA